MWLCTYYVSLHATAVSHQEGCSLFTCFEMVSGTEVTFASPHRRCPPLRCLHLQALQWIIDTTRYNVSSAHLDVEFLELFLSIFGPAPPTAHDGTLPYLALSPSSAHFQLPKRRLRPFNLWTDAQTTRRLLSRRLSHHPLLSQPITMLFPPLHNQHSPPRLPPGNPPNDPFHDRH
jgi:hypothetical protein